MAELYNLAHVDFSYGGTAMESESAVTVQIPALSVIKTADKTEWLGGDLVYTITIKNVEEGTIDATSVVFTDTINKDYATLVAGTVVVNSVTLDPEDYQFVPETGVLTISLDDITPGGTTTVSFHVKKV